MFVPISQGFKSVKDIMLYDTCINQFHWHGSCSLTINLRESHYKPAGLASLPQPIVSDVHCKIIGSLD